MNSVTRHRWRLLVTVAAGLMLITLDNSILYTALPTLAYELGATASQSLWIINAYPLVMAGLLLGSGTLGDRIGHRKMFLIGLTLFGVASISAAFSPTPELLIASRAFLAVGAAAMMPSTLALIRLTFEDEQERNLAIAIWGSLSVVGAALGPIVGGLLLSQFWWGSVFLINLPIVILAIVGAVLYAPADTPDVSRSWDFLSSLLALLTLSGLVLAIKEVTHVDVNGLLMASYVTVALVSGWLFVRRQSQLAYPLLNFSIFRNPAFSAGVLAAAAAMFTIGGMQLVTTQRFQLVAGFSPVEAGLLVSAVALGCLPTALVAGAVLHKVGLRLLIAGGLALSAVAALLTPIALELGLWWMVAAMSIAGAGLGSVMAVASAAIVGNVPPERAGMASSVEEVSYEFGSLIAVALLGSLLSSIYAARVVLPINVPDYVREDGIAGALAFAQTLGGDGTALAQAASQAFDDGYRIALYVIGIVLALAALSCRILLRRYGPGSEATMHASH